MKTVRKAVKIFGTSIALSNAVGVRPDRVSKWLRNLYFPSIQNALKIEEVTEGKVKAIDILNEKMQIKLKAMQKKVKE